jgi:hypothetical protein
MSHMRGEIIAANSRQIPEFPDFGRQGINPPKPDYSNPLPDMYPQGDLPQGWGLTFFLHQHPGPTGRSGKTGWWAGLPNLFWWADRENGLGGMIASQVCWSNMSSEFG